MGKKINKTPLLTPEFWSKAWDEAKARSTVLDNQVNDDKWLDFWNSISDNYLENVRQDSKLINQIVSAIKKEGLISNTSRVLDIGAGPGTYSIPIAKNVFHVTAIDQAQRMLDNLLSEARERKIHNIDTLCCKWQDCNYNEEFDLVLAAFSPAINDASSLLKMNKAAIKFACVITFSRIDDFSFKIRNDLWKMIAGKPFISEGFRVIYPFNFLYTSGFRPQLRIFKYRIKFKKLAQQLITQYEDYFRIFVNLQKKHKDIIQDYFNGISEQGIIKAQTTREIYVMWWDVKDKKEE